MHVSNRVKMQIRKKERNTYTQKKQLLFKEKKSQNKSNIYHSKTSR